MHYDKRLFFNTRKEQIMAVFKVNANKNYTVMSNYHLQDKNLSLKAKGLLSYMLSLPSDWDYSVNGLVAKLKENKTAVQSALKELEEQNYLRRTKIKDEKGQFDYIYDIYEQPYMQMQYADSPAEEKPQTENLGMENPCTESMPQINTNKQITKEQNTNKQNTKDIYICDGKKTAYGCYGRVKLTTAEYQRLVDEFGQDYIDRQIDLLDEYVESNNNKNKYTNFNLVIRKAIREKWFDKKETKNNGNAKRYTASIDYDQFIDN